MSIKLNYIFVGSCLMVILGSGLAFAGENIDKRKGRTDRPLSIKVVPWGPSQAQVDAAKQRVVQSALVQNELKGVKYRYLGFEYIDEVGDKNRASQPPTRFRTIFYDYTNDRTLAAEGDFAGKEAVSTRWILLEPGADGEEIKAAYRIVAKDSEFSDLKRMNKIEFYEAMPPVSNLNGERLVNIGVRNPDTGANQIVGVSFKNEKVIRYENNAPPTSAATPEACGIQNANQGSTGIGVAGQVQFTVMESGSPLWEMLVIRPSSSSGKSNERSGLEIRDVKYRGKSVLKRGHVPVLNVQYTTGCGPFRDWQYSEGFFNAPEAGSTNPAPGIRVLAAGQVATTAVETRNDTGNFQGVAIYTQDTGFGPEAVMVTEMDAGWYRYIMEWRFAPDGTIRPRYGFGSVTDSCVCLQRTHHVYWRFDFDIVTPVNKIFQVERGRKFLTAVTNEAAIFRSTQGNRRFLIQNSTGDEAYQLTPGVNDGSVTNPLGMLTDTFGGGDFWLMRFQGTADSPNELDDQNPPGTVAANFAPWINNESLVDQDVVVWYAAHQTRVDDASRPNIVAPEIISGVHVVGPDLRPVRW